MVPVQYRDSASEELLDWRHVEDVPAIGEEVGIGYERYRVLYRSRCVPTSCSVYVVRVPREVRGPVAA